MTSILFTVLLAAQPSSPAFVPAVPKDDLAAEIRASIEANELVRKTAFERQAAYVAEGESLLRKAKSSPIPNRSFAADKRRIVEEAEKDLAGRIAEQRRIGSDPNYCNSLPRELVVGAIGSTSYPLVVSEILGDHEAIVELLDVQFQRTVSGKILNNQTIRDVILKRSTAGLADGSKIEIAGPLRVSGTRKLGGETLFVLEPFDVTAHVK